MRSDRTWRKLERDMRNSGTGQARIESNRKQGIDLRQVVTSSTMKTVNEKAKNILITR